MKLLIVNNLASGYGEGGINDFIRLFASDGDEICVRSTNGGCDIRDFLHDAADFDLVVASGGDGTIATVSYALRNTGIPILPFPAGTANLLALNLALPFEPYALSVLARSGKVLDFDMGELELGGATYGFSLIAGAGYDATIMQYAAPAKRLLGPIAYLGAAVTHALAQKSTFSLKLDGMEIEREALGVLILNFSKIQFDISVTHHNLPRDGAFEVVLLKATTAFALIPDIIAGFLDRDGEFPNRSDVLEVHRANMVEVSADPPMEVQYDGEVTGLTTPFKARVLKKATRFVVSDEGYDRFH
ncbi:MAG: NAD(+)/NADH kinase [Eggerthellaceae bacterium]|nr:NAD(+)/NADH kinase [Eggerthellaceae bacterium]